MSWDWLRDGLGGAADFVTGGLTDFDQKGSGGYNWMPGTMGTQFNPIFGGSDKKWGEEPKFDFDDAVGSFTKGYMGQMGPGSSTPGGSSFLNAYTSGRVQHLLQVVQYQLHQHLQQVVRHIRCQVS